MAFRIWLCVLCVPLAVYGQLIPVVTGPRPYPRVPVPSISNVELDNAFAAADREKAARAVSENNLRSTGGIIPPGTRSPESRHQRFVSEFGQASKMDQIQELFEGATRNLASQKRLTPEQIRFGLPLVPLTSAKAQAAKAQCDAMYKTSCFNSKYRTADGSCNNLRKPSWGKSFTCFQRLLPANYDDGISVPRKSVVNGGPLPNARQISRIVHTDVNIESTEYTHMVMQFGQFLDHDFSLTPMTRTANNGMIECCPNETNPTVFPSHPECFPIAISPNDEFFSQFRQTCMNFVRSAACTQCYLGPRDQTDQLTAFIDASQVYGSTLEDTKILRLFRDGLLKFTPSDQAGDLLPPSNDTANDQCSNVNQNQICFLAGDTRVNEQPGLTAMHTIWLRQHNRIATELKFYNRLWDDETLFQEARRIIGAQIQTIAYGEFLPVVLGSLYMDYFKLHVSGGRTAYDQTTEPTILHEFGTAAYRFGHTLIRNLFSLGAQRQQIRLRDFFFFPFGIRTGDLDGLMTGLASQPAMQYDRHIVEAVTNCVYCQRDSFGMDLPALNIQRGRDHGLNSYVSYLNYCFNQNIQSFADLRLVMNDDAISKLQAVYKSVGDIDLFPGGVSERSLSGAVVGPTFGCIIGLQFFHLKFGDRFYFEHGGQSGSFTDDQLLQIKQTSLARVICANSRVSAVQPNIFLPPTVNNINPIVACDALAELDLGPWQQ